VKLNFNFRVIYPTLSRVNSNQYSPAILISALLFCLPLVYIDSIRDYSSLPRYAILGVSSGLILAIILIGKLFDKNPPQVSQYFIMSVVAFLGWAWLSLIWSVDPKNALIELIQLTGCIIISYSITQIQNDKIFNWLIISSVTGASLAALIGIAQYFGFNPFDYRQFVAPASTFTNPNFAAIYLDLITPVSFFLIFLANKKRYKVLATLSSSLCLSFILLSHNRGSWLGLVFVSIGLLLLLYRNSNFKNIFIPLVKQHKFHLLISILIPFLIFSIPSNVSEQPLKNSQLTFDGSAKVRLDAYINSLSIIKDNPIKGEGYGSFKTSFKSYMFSTVPFLGATEDRVLIRLHSDLLQSFVELGIIGGLLFISIYIVVLLLCWNIIKTSTNSNHVLITSGIFLAIIANAIHSGVDYPFHKPTSALQFWVWFGIIIALSIKTTPKKVIYIHKYIAVLLVIFGVTFSIFNFHYYQNYISASQYRLIANKDLKEKNCISAKQNADEMMALFDADFHHQTLYVDVYSQCDIENNQKLFAMNRILTYDKTNTRALITRGTIFLQQTLTANAVRDFTAVTNILPHRASGFIGLTYASLQKKNITTALNLLAHALKLEPNNEIAKNLLKKLQP
jgi:O-antigen ligase